MPAMSFVKACVDYFGKKPGQSLGDFQAELKALTDKDRADIIGYFAVIGWEVTTPAK